MVDTLKSIKTTRAVIWHFWPMIPIYIWFFGSNHQVTTYFDQKNQHFEFLSFFTTTSIRTSILANLTHLPPPHGAPPLTTHPTTFLDVFPTQQAQEWRFLAKFWPFLQYFNFEGCTSKTPFLGPDRPTLKKWWGPRTQRKSRLMIFLCHANLITCPNFLHRCFLHFWEILNTPILQYEYTD